MGRVLIICPRFPPANAPDAQRVRLSLAYYRSLGWEPTVLCVEPSAADGAIDPVLDESVPAATQIVRVQGWRQATCRLLGFGQLAYRSLWPLYRAGSSLLRRDHYDVVFFSTTMFLCFALGPLWKRLYGCRIVYDFQDPWYEDRLPYTRATVPGRWWKYRLDRWLARHLERFAIRAADHIVTVSEGYAATLARRYPKFDASRFTILPFAAPDSDYALVRRFAIAQEVVRGDDGRVHWVYAGAVVPAMAPVLAALFRALAALAQRDGAFAARLQLDFVGTDYAPAGRTRNRVEPLATQHRVAAVVREFPERIPYFTTLALNLAGDGLLIVGSTDPDYTPSKLLGCVLSKKPILALLHRRSPAAALAARFPNVRLATFEATPDEPEFADQVAAGLGWLRAPEFDIAAIDHLVAPWSAAELTRRQCAIFDRLASAAAEEPTRSIKARPAR